MTATVDPTTLIGERYILEKLIGEGGTGEVWRARHVTLRSPVAIKLLHGSAAFRDSTRRRFLTEARVAAQLNTRHAVTVFDFGVTKQGRPYLIMELLDGETLADRLARQHMLTPYATARVLRLASRALDAAHALGVVHRDFKPENIFLVRTEEEEEDVKVVDFGVAKLVGELEEDDEEDEEDSAAMSSRRFERASMSFTRSGRSVGTPCYMAPEQAKAQDEVGQAADVWAIGVVAYECLTGFRPFVADDIQTLFDRISTCTYVPGKERNPALPEEFDDWFRTVCSPDPEKRFANASSATMALIEVLGIQISTITFADNDAVHSLVPSVRSPSSNPVGPPSSRPGGRSVTPGGAIADRARPRVQPKTSRNVAFGVALALMGVVAWISWGQLRVATAPSGTTSVGSAAEHLACSSGGSLPVLAVSSREAKAASTASEHEAVPLASTGGGRASPKPGHFTADVPKMGGHRRLPSVVSADAFPLGAAGAPPEPEPPAGTASAEESSPPPGTASAKAPSPPPDSAGTGSPFKLPELGF